MKIRQIIFLILGAAVSLAGVLAIILLTAKPTIKVDYVAKVNEITKPKNYDPNKNSKPLLEEAVKGLNDTPKFVGEIGKWPGDMNEGELVSLRQWFSSHGPSVAKLREAAGRPYYWMEQKSKTGKLYDVLCLSIGDFRPACYVLVTDAKLKAMDIDGDGFFESISDSFEFSRQLDARGTLVEQLVAMSMQGVVDNTVVLAIGRKGLEANLLKRLQDEYETNPAWGFKWTVSQSGRIYLCDWMQTVFTDNGHGDGRLILKNLIYEYEQKYEPMPWYRGVYLTLTEPGRKETLATGERFYDRVDELAETAPMDLPSSEAELDSAQYRYMVELYRITNRCKILSEDVPSFAKICAINVRTRSYHHAMAAILAEKRYENERGKTAESLEQLIEAGYLKSAPVDAFSGKALIYKKVGEKEFELYSVGDDLKDGGGGDKNTDLIFWPVEKSSLIKK